MNTRPNERFLYRRTTHCAPLVTEGYKSMVNFTDSGVEMKYSQYAYGSSVVSKGGNITYVYPVPQRSAQERWTSRRSATTTLPDYTLGFVSRVHAIKFAAKLTIIGIHMPMSLMGPRRVPADLHQLMHSEEPMQTSRFSFCPATRLSVLLKSTTLGTLPIRPSLVLD